MKKKNITAIVLAAGQGKRMNSSVAKQFITLRDKPVLYYSLKAFEDSSVDEVILVTEKCRVEYCKENIVMYYNMNKVKKIIEGGKERYDSVYRALQHAGRADYVLIHDGARPFITKELIEKIIQQVKDTRACIVGIPVKDTIKIVDQSGYISSTPNRNTLWAAQTPQAFEYASIRKAYDIFYKEKDMKEFVVTDDAMVYETFLKQQVKMFLGDNNNLKITTPEDLKLAEVLLNELLFEKTK